MSDQVAYRNIYNRKSDTYIDLFRVSLFGSPLEDGFEVNMPIAKNYSTCVLANLSETTGEITRVTAGENLYRACTNLDSLISCFEPGTYVYQIVITGPNDFRKTVVEGQIINEQTISTIVNI